MWPTTPSLCSVSGREFIDFVFLIVFVIVLLCDFYGLFLLYTRILAAQLLGVVLCVTKTCHRKFSLNQVKAPLGVPARSGGILTPYVYMSWDSLACTLFVRKMVLLQLGRSSCASLLPFSFEASYPSFTHPVNSMHTGKGKGTTTAYRCLFLFVVANL